LLIKVKGGDSINIELPELSTVKQVADFLQVHEMTIRRVIKSGELKGLRVGKNWRIEKQSLNDWLEKQNKQNEKD
jgi:excisionase family DNA binding protein